MPTSSGFLPQAIHALINSTIPIYDSIAPQNARAPFAVMTLITEEPWNHLGGRPSVRDFVYQIDVYARSALSRSELARSVLYILENYAGTVIIGGVSPVTTVAIQACILQSARQEIEEDTDPKLWRQSMDFKFAVTESTHS